MKREICIATYRTHRCALLILVCALSACAKCEKIVDNYNNGDLLKAAEHCVDLGKEIEKNKKKVEGVVKKCDADQSSGGERINSDPFDIAGIFSESSFSRGKGDACGECAGVADICSEVGAPLPDIATDAEAACCVAN